MNIQQAISQLESTIRAYTARTADGVPVVPVEAQRPVYLEGPPGVGKTAVMGQIARSLNIGLVSYTMTHHTRQSALGLPVI
ncbi:MAG: AAA family ATPase, partial [Clostridia bacterium]|nr:AAA family ATPase [Clostridia bacterium]